MHLNLLKSALIISALALFAAQVSPKLAAAHAGASGIIKERMEAMSEIAQSMKAIGNMLRGKTDFDEATVTKAAATIKTHASEMLALFPEGSTSHPSEALPAIWENWETFEKLTQEMQTLSVKITSGPVTLEGIKPKFAELAKNCSACHEKFRLKK